MGTAVRRVGRQIRDSGCRLWLDVHHLHGFAEGGDHSAGNLVTLCPSHHRLLHEGNLALERLRDGRLVVEHADGRRLVATHVGHGTSDRGGTAAER